MAIPLSAVARRLPEWMHSGLGDEEFYNEQYRATFPATTCPPVLPCLDNHHSIMSDVLKAHPELYYQLLHVKSSGGVPLAKCLKTGMDNRGHPMIKTVGFVCADEDCYNVFWSLLRPIIAKRHKLKTTALDSLRQVQDLDCEKLSRTPIDPTERYVISTRIRTGRSIRNFLLPPSISFEDRRKLEDLIVHALRTCDAQSDPSNKSSANANLTPTASMPTVNPDTFDVKYLPLVGSSSFPHPASCPNVHVGTTRSCEVCEEREETLRSRGMLFQEPNSTLLLSSGFGRHWPDARGMLVNKEENFLIWLNEEDHLRIIAMEKGSNMRRVFSRWTAGLRWTRRRLADHGLEYQWSDRLGFLSTCPSNLGTGMRASVMVRLPLLSQQPNFKQLANKLGLQVRGSRGVDSQSVAGIYDISNRDRLGQSEVQLCNTVIEGVAALVRAEHSLESAADTLGEDEMNVKKVDPLSINRGKVDERSKL